MRAPRSSATEQTVAELAEHASDSRWIFGYNEPETHMDPREAAHFWPDAELLAATFSFRLTSPCMVNYDTRAKKWLRTFVDAFVEHNFRAPRFDVMCLHLYLWQSDAAQSTMMARIEEMAADYGRLVWVNEWSCPPWEGCGEDLQMEQMRRTLPLFAASPLVFRFAWFDARDRKPGISACNLLEADNSTKTPLGELYDSYSLRDEDAIAPSR